MTDMRINQAGTATFTGPDRPAMPKGKSLEGYCASNISVIADKITIGGAAREYWATQKMEDAANAADEVRHISTGGQTVEDILRDAVGWRSAGAFLNGQVEADNTQVEWSPCGRHNANVLDSITSQNGLKVDVHTPRDDFSQPSKLTLTAASGVQIELEAHEDMRIQEKEDGSLLVTFLNSGKTQHHLPDGTMSDITGESPLYDPEAGSTYIDFKAQFMLCNR